MEHGKELRLMGWFLVLCLFAIMLVLLGTGFKDRRGLRQERAVMVGRIAELENDLILTKASLKGCKGEVEMWREKYEKENGHDETR